MKTKAIIITTSAITAIGAAALAWWSTTASFTLFRIGYLNEPLKEHVNTEAIANHYVDFVIAEATYQSITQASDRWEAAGSVFGAALAEQLKPALKTQNERQVNDAINAIQKLLDQGDRSFVKSVYKSGDSVIVSLFYNDTEAEVVMSRQSGRWEFAQIADETIRKYLAEQPTATSQQLTVEAPTRPAMPEPTPQTYSPTPDVSVHQYATLQASDPKAQINIRDQPTTASQSHSYGVVGDRVKILDSTTNMAGEKWFEVYFQQSDTKGWIRSDFVLVDGI